MDKKCVSVTLTVLIFFISTGTFAFENKHKIGLVVGERNITIGDRSTIIDSEPIEKDGKIYIEINTLKHLEGVDVGYDQATKKISITQERPKMFTNGSERSELINLINKSKTIFIQMYLLTDNDIVEALHKRAYLNKDAMIRIILFTDYRNQSFKKDHYTERYIENSSKNREGREISLVNWHSGRKESKSPYKSMHRKIAVFDNRTIFIGSTNWTEAAFKDNWESGMILNDKVLANDFTNQFLNDWKLTTSKWENK